MKHKTFKIALTGNPNAGKTTIFNNITGTRQKVGNWPGVTVEKKEGKINKFGYELNIIDLPGTYSLTPFSIEEIIARNFVLDEHPDVVVNIIDASNLERSLYLATQIRELDCRVVFVLNMADLARSRGMKIDADMLSDLLNVPVVFTVGNKNEGIDTLLQKVVELAESPFEIPKERRVKYNKDIEKSITHLQTFLDQKTEKHLPYNSRWLAIKLIENDKIVKERVLKFAGSAAEEILNETEMLRRRLMDYFDEDPEIIMTDERYGFITGIIKEVLTTSTRKRVDISRNIDLVLTNRFLGFPIFIFFIWAMFQLTFSLGGYPMVWIEHAISLFSGLMASLLPAGIIKNFIVDGVITGVGSVIIFLPNILILFFCIAIFEDTGYMSRAAFLMDRIMHLIGLHGKSFIPMLMAFGCNVPAIMATRTLESRKDRLLTILITPFMSCSARLPVFIILAGTFFPNKAGTVIFSLYLLGIALAMISGRLLRLTILRGTDAPFVMELPPYRIPMLKSLLIHMWDRSKMFLRKMGGVILVGSVIIWGLSTFPRNIQYSRDYAGEINYIESTYEKTRKSENAEAVQDLKKKKQDEIEDIVKSKKIEETEKSFLGRIGKFLAPIFAPIGIGWKGSVALLSGFVAKEIVVSTLGILYAIEDDAPEALSAALAVSEMTPLSALSMMVFVLLYIPCFATVAVIGKETQSVKWVIFVVVYTTLVAWGVSFIIYQGARLLGIP